MNRSAFFALVLMLASHAGAGEDARCARREVAIELPDLALRDARSSTPVRVRPGLDGSRRVMVEFVFTSCPAICPALAGAFASIQKRFAAAGGELFSITIDPEHDTPERLQAFAKSLSADPTWHFLTGSAEDIAALQRAFGVFQEDKSTHRPVIFVRPRGANSWVRLDGFPSGDRLLKECAKSAVAE